MDIINKLEILAEKGKINYTDYYFALFIRDFFSNKNSLNDEMLLITAILSNETSKGSVCLSIERLINHPLINEIGLKIDSIHYLKEIFKTYSNIIKDAKEIHNNEFIDKPIIIDNNRLYIAKYWNFEKDIAKEILKRVMIKCNDIDFNKLTQYIKLLYPNGKYHPDWQKIGVLLSVINNLSVISGGPGTGKTRTVASILLILKKLADDKNKILRIGLCAPTGKAAARLSESINGEISRFREIFNEDKEWLDIINSMPREAQTIHRLLKYSYDKSIFKQNRDNPLELDVLVIDEVSMVDLPLMANIFYALPINCKLILLGDKDQLSSVESGTVLGDICECVKNYYYSKDTMDLIKKITDEDISFYHKDLSKTLPLRDSITILTHSYRFDENSGIGNLSRAINNGDINGVINILSDNKYTDLILKEISKNEIKNEITVDFINNYKKYLSENNPLECLSKFNNFRILCAINDGFYGVNYINQLVENILIENGLILKNRRWYRGRPIMILENDYSLNLFNGDIGIILTDEKTNNNMAYFLSENNDIKSYTPVKLPKHESVYAMTIHKSQGSDFEEVIVILPEINAISGKTNEILTRELLYTAITRAKKKLIILGNKETICSMVKKSVNRSSGLWDRLEGIYD